MTPSIDDPRVIQGHNYLLSIMTRASERAKQEINSLGFQPGTMIAQNALQHIEEKNLYSLCIHEQSPGKWVADLYMKGLPTGVPSVFGTPKATPLNSREEAEEMGFLMVVGILVSIYSSRGAYHETKPRKETIFQLDDFAFEVPAQAVEAMVKARAMVVGDGYTDDSAEMFLLKSRFDIMGAHAELTEEALKAASEEQMAKLMTAMALMLSFGRFRYPD